MTYDDYKNHLKVCEFLGKPPVGKYESLHVFLGDFWEGMEFTVHRGEVILYKNNNEVHMFSDSGYGHMECNWDGLWSFLRTDTFLSSTCLEYDDVSLLIKGIVGEYLAVVNEYQYYSGMYADVIRISQALGERCDMRLDIGVP